MDRDRANRVWDRMQEMYGNTFVTQYGHVPLLTWVQAIGLMSDEELKQGLQACAMSGDTFPPTLPAFIEMCRPPKNRPEHLRYDANDKTLGLPMNPPMSEEQKKASRERAKESIQKLKEVLR